MLDVNYLRTRKLMSNLFNSVSDRPSCGAAVNILVVGSLTPPGVSDDLKSILVGLSENVTAALHRAGAQARFVEASNPARAASAVLADMHGLLILGGADADPACYGQKAEADTMYGINPAADDFELQLIRDARAQALPILGICRGMQLLNIAHGGDLIQEIGPGTMHNGASDNALMVCHEVSLEPRSRLAAIYEERALTIRSGHHQAVGRLGEGLVVTASAADGIVEAVESRDAAWVVGVQWHPEDPVAPVRDLDRLVAGFIQACSS